MVNELETSAWENTGWSFQTTSSAARKASDKAGRTVWKSARLCGLTIGVQTGIFRAARGSLGSLSPGRSKTNEQAPGDLPIEGTRQVELSGACECDRGFEY